MTKEYDFYAYGCKVARENQINFEKLLTEIEQRYGHDAKNEVYQGYHNTLSENLSRANKSVIENQILKVSDVKQAEDKYSEEIEKNGVIR